jgi:hypothetical protein
MIHNDPCISCTCGHVATVDAWTSTPINGELPRDQFQCPNCNRAFRVVPNPNAKPWQPVRLIQPVEARL